jgi:hypothetical protein
MLALTTGKVLTTLDTGNVAPVSDRLARQIYRFN